MIIIALLGLVSGQGESEPEPSIHSNSSSLILISFAEERKLLSITLCNNYHHFA